MSKYILIRRSIESIGVVLLVSALTGCLPYTTGSEEVAVITNKSIFGGKGVKQEIQQKGTTKFLVPFLTDWHPFDVSSQILDMTATSGRGDRRGRDDLTFKTIDGNDVSLDIVIRYQIDPTETPNVLQTVGTNNEELKENIVRPVARSISRDIFGELNTEEFYVSSKRAEKAVEVMAKMNSIFESYGIRVTDVETQDYRFNAKYQRAIEEKKIADQMVERNRAATNAAMEEYIRKVEEAKGDVEQVRAKADGEFRRATIEVDAYVIQQERLAEAIEAEGRAEAEGILKMNEALAGAGGENMVKLAIADALKGKRILMIPIGGGGMDIRTTDVNALLELYGVQRMIERRPQPVQLENVVPEQIRRQIQQQEQRRRAGQN